MSTNWIKQSQPTLTIKDKLITLLKSPSKLVLVQKNELERLRRNFKSMPFQNEYINTLYDHYIVQGLPKQYLCNNTNF